MSKSTANDRPSDRPMPFEYVCQRVEFYFTSIQRCAVLFDSLSRRSSVRQSIGRVYSVGPVYTQIHFDSLYNHIILYMSRTVCIHEHDYSIQFHSDTATLPHSYFSALEVCHKRYKYIDISAFSFLLLTVQSILKKMILYRIEMLKQKRKREIIKCYIDVKLLWSHREYFVNLHAHTQTDRQIEFT